jgi:uncharacterized membrane protein YgdD (TMEM256/DUF423 family)
MTAKRCLMLSALAGFLAVALGAFGAHFLKDSGYLVKRHAAEPEKDSAGFRMPASHKYLLDFQTGVEYHMWHALALGLTGLLLRSQQNRWLRVAAWSFLTGIVFFSGSLYILVIGGPRFGGVPWGAIVPIGGTAFLIGWICLAGGSLCLSDKTQSADS